MPDHSPPVITVAAVVLLNEQGHVLTVRKRGTSRFMLPGGKPEPGETPMETAIRECFEETGLRLAVAEVELLGEFEADAANEPGHLLRSTVFLRIGVVTDPVNPRAEIEAFAWLDPVSRPLPGNLAPMLTANVLPALNGRAALNDRHCR